MTQPSTVPREPLEALAAKWKSLADARGKLQPDTSPGIGVAYSSCAAELRIILSAAHPDDDQRRREIASRIPSDGELARIEVFEEPMEAATPSPAAQEFDLPTEPGWWIRRPTNQVVRVKLNKSTSPPVLYFNDYDDNIHGFAVDDGRLPNGRWLKAWLGEVEREELEELRAHVADLKFLVLDACANMLSDSPESYAEVKQSFAGDCNVAMSKVTDALATAREEKEKAEKKLASEQSDHSDFLAFMTASLAEWPCNCTEDQPDHSATPPMCWPELIACIIKRAVKDATKAALEKAKTGRNSMAEMLAHCDCTEGPCPFGIQAADKEDSPCTAKQLAEKLKSVLNGELVDFFRTEEEVEGRQGDLDNISTAQCAIRLIRKLRSQLAAAGQVIAGPSANTLPEGEYVLLSNPDANAFRWRFDGFAAECYQVPKGQIAIRLPDTQPPTPVKADDGKRLEDIRELACTANHTEAIIALCDILAEREGGK